MYWRCIFTVFHILGMIEVEIKAMIFESAEIRKWILM